jgi:hypothetical protein
MSQLCSTVLILQYVGGQDSCVAMETRCGLEGPVFEFQWMRFSPCHPDRSQGPPPSQPPIELIPGLYRGKTAERSVMTTRLFLVPGCEWVDTTPFPLCV